MNPVPPMTNPMGLHWQQPDPAAMVFDRTHVLMTIEAFHQLRDYSHSIPTGVYDGKMWRRLISIFSLSPSDPKLQCWNLCWYEPSQNPGECQINERRILIA